MSDLERVVKEAEILKWAEENRNCKLTDAPHWIIMALMEDIVYFDRHLVEQLVMALNGSWGAVMQDGYLEHATEKLMTNVLLASLHEETASRRRLWCSTANGSNRELPGP